MHNQQLASDLELIAIKDLISKWTREASDLNPYDGLDISDVLKKTKAHCLIARSADLGKITYNFQRFGGEFPLSRLNALVESWGRSIAPTDTFLFRGYPLHIKEEAISTHESTVSICIDELKKILLQISSNAS